MPQPRTSPSTVQSVDRALTVLEILAREGQSSAGAIARELGVHGSTVSRLLPVLEQHGLVERDEGGVRLGAGVLRLAGAAVPGRDLTRWAAPVCEELARRVGETVNVAVLREGGAVNLCQAQGPSTVAMHNWVGDRTVLHATSSGKVLLAHAEPAQREEVLSHPLERFTERTLTERSALLRELEQVRERGWAAAVEEFEPGLNALAVPIRGAQGSVIAALSVAGPAYRLGAERLPELSRTLEAAAEEITRRLLGGAGGAGVAPGAGPLGR